MHRNKKKCVCVCEKEDAERLNGGEKEEEAFNRHRVGHDLAACKTPPLAALQEGWLH